MAGTPAISLTDFVDFTISSGTPKLSKVSEILRRGDYHPATDFWRPLRESIIEFHATGLHDRRELEKIVARMADAKKHARAAECVTGYKKFLGRKNVKWFEPPKARWSSGGLEVRVNPELGLRIDGAPHVLKLYFKREPLSKRRVDIVFTLLHDATNTGAPADTSFGIVDVPRGKLYASKSPNRALLPLLQGEAISFKTIWDSLSSGP